MTDTPHNRSEIVFVTDAQDCNPNGDPLGDNRPRIDPVTGQAVVTDVRLKRYLRDQLQSDGHPVFVKKTDEGTSAARAELALDVLEDIETVEDVEQADDIGGQFLDAAADVRYFGATLSFNKDPEKEVYAKVKEAFRGTQYTGPVQFSPARSLNAVERNEESDTLTSVISTQEGKDVGGYGLDDHRIKYGIFPFHGLVDEHGAADTQLTRADVRRLDTLCWRALKNQTISRSKVGQEPRLYLRAEYSTPGYHVGDLHNAIEIDTEESKPDDELRNATDLTLDVTRLVERLSDVSGSDGGTDHLDTVHVVGDDYVEITHEGASAGTLADLPGLLESSGVPVRRVDVYDEFQATLADSTAD